MSYKFLHLKFYVALLLALLTSTQESHTLRYKAHLKKDMLVLYSQNTKHLVL
jgi:hypothetical protein